MIASDVNADLQATLRLYVSGPQGPAAPVEALVDTGYNGDLTLPPTAIARLGLLRLGWRRATLANGTEEVFDVYEALVIWDGQPRTVEVDAADAEPLLGMALLEGHELRMQVRDGGVVTVAALP